MSKVPKNMPFEFVLGLLHPLEVEIKPMFGCFSLYAEGKLILFLREGEKDPQENGVWVAASDEGYEELAKAIGVSVDDDMRNAAKKWLLLTSAAEEFESAVTSVCEMIVSGDPRIGRLSKG